MKTKKKYFIEDEYLETISDQKVFDPNAELVTKEYVYRCNGAVYHGQWKGGFRHGDGIIKWKDGAQYNGQWVMGRA